MNDRMIEVPFALERAAGDEGDGRTLEGYAAVFNSPSPIQDQLGDYDEVILPGAFARTIKARTPVLMFNHGKNPLWQNMPIGKIEELREDPRGLFVRAKLTDNWLIDPIRDAIRDEAIEGMSFRFEVPSGKATEERQANGRTLRSIREVKLYELGPVTFPAYNDTSVAVRSLGTVVPEVQERIDAAATIADLAARLETLEEREVVVTLDVNQAVAGVSEVRDAIEELGTSEELVREDTSEELAATSDSAVSHSPDPADRTQRLRHIEMTLKGVGKAK